MQRAHAALYYAGLEEKRYQPIDGYSTGMKQRVKLAQALVHDPEILFLDEPTNGLDPRSREEMLDLIAELPARRNCAIVLSTHLLPDVERVCDQAVIMNRGAVRFAGTIDELHGARGRDSELAVEVKADAARLAEALTTAGALCRVTSPTALEVDLPASATSLLVFRTAHAAGLQVRALGVRRESVEAAFLRVLGDPTVGPLGVPQSALTRAIAGGTPGAIAEAIEERSESAASGAAGFAGGVSIERGRVP
jgi:ABC-2 type transport system ATP-binding protein